MTHPIEKLPLRDSILIYLRDIAKKTYYLEQSGKEGNLQEILESLENIKKCIVVVEIEIDKEMQIRQAAIVAWKKEETNLRSG